MIFRVDENVVIPKARSGYPESILPMVVMDSGFEAAPRPGMTDI